MINDVITLNPSKANMHFNLLAVWASMPKVLAASSTIWRIEVVRRGTSLLHAGIFRNALSVIMMVLPFSAPWRTRKSSEKSSFTFFPSQRKNDEAALLAALPHLIIVMEPLEDPRSLSCFLLSALPAILMFLPVAIKHSSSRLKMQCD